MNICTSCQSLQQAAGKCGNCGASIDATFNAKYRFVKKIGEGGMGATFAAQHGRLDRPCVVKLIRIASSVDRGRLEERFLAEAKAVAKIDHPNVVQIYDSDDALPNGTPYIVYEFVDGMTIGKSILDNGRFDWKHAIQVAGEVLEGLQATHDKEVVHRDISPQNIMLATTGQVKIIDFGLAKFEGTRRTTTGRVFGNFGYTSPEQLGKLQTGEKIDGRADIYSFALVLWEMMAGVAVVRGTAIQCIATHSADTALVLPPLTAEVPSEVQLVIRRALEKDRERRFQSSRDFRKALLAAAPGVLSPSISIAAVTDESEGAAVPAADGFTTIPANLSTVVQHVPTERSSLETIPLSLQQVASITKSPAIHTLEDRLGIQLDGIDGVLIRWMSSTSEGVRSDAVRVEPTWIPDGTEGAFGHLSAVSSMLRQYGEPYREDVKQRFRERNNPKLWLKSFRSPLSERSVATFEVGRTDYWSVKSIERAFDHGELLVQYENGSLSTFDDSPGLIGAVVPILTSDNHFILAQRRRGEVDFAGGSWTATFEEAWDPLREAVPFETVIRGLSEEFNIDPRHGVTVEPGHIRLYAVGREWGAYYNTVLIYAVHLPATAGEVLECWQSFPPPQDKNEHIAIAAVPLDERGTQFLMNLVTMPRQEKLSVPRLKGVCSAERIAGTPSDEELLPTHGRAKIIVGLFANGYWDKERALSVH